MAEKTKAELQQELDEANDKIAKLSADQSGAIAADTRVKELESKLTDSEKRNSELTQSLTGAEKDLNDALNLISEQNEALAKEDTYSESTIITVAGKKYRVVVPAFNVGGDVVKAADLKENKKLAAELVAKGSSILELLG